MVMLQQRLRRAAEALMKAAIRVAPRETRAWGCAMLAEIGYLDGSWSALAWALGGVGVLIAESVSSLLFGDRRAHRAAGVALFRRRVSIGRAMLAPGASCIVAALLFLAAPPFRQACRVAFSPWARLIQPASSNGQPALEALTRRAVRNRDAEAMTFCALRVKNGEESAQLATQAVAIDPRLVWMYGAVSVRHPGLPEASEWIPALERSDPRNAYPFLIAAANIDFQHARLGDVALLGHENDPQWRSAMAAAFRAAKFDDYDGRLNAVDRKVGARYRLNDPEVILLGAADVLPTSAVEDSRRFAQPLLEKGRVFETRGERTRAQQQYLAVARFGQLIDSQGNSAAEHRVGMTVQGEAYQRLASLTAKQGSPAQAAMYGYLSAKFAAVPAEQAHPPQWLFGRYVCERNAKVLVVSGLAMLVFSALLLAAGSILLVRRGRRLGPTPQTAGPMATIVAMSSALGLFVTAAALYLTYRPYWYIFQQSVSHGERSEAQDLSAFLTSTRTMFDGSLGASPSVHMYFWAVVTLLGVLGLTLIFLRHIRIGAGTSGLHGPKVS
jgi:hypothetical protein